jgi:DNA repair exonuclease SbcCD nuclease subunit
MRRFLFIGDPHVTLDSLDECRALVKFIAQVAKDNAVDRIVVLGDLYHNHAVVRVEIIEFWRWAFELLAAVSFERVVALKGNHDMSGVLGSMAHSLLAHKDNDSIQIVDEPIYDIVDYEDPCGWLLYIPYIVDPEEFVDICQKNNQAQVVICHQSFLGFKYENGAAIEDGIDFNRIPQSVVISGHIHTPQKRDKVWYIGAPRWRTIADANVDRAIQMVDFQSNGIIVNTKSFDTGSICSKILHFRDTPDAPMPMDMELKSKDRVTVDIIGPQAYIEKRSKEFHPAIKLRTFRTDDKVIRIKESEGIDKAMQSFLEEYQPKYGTPKDVLQQMLKERLERNAGLKFS